MYGRIKTDLGAELAHLRERGLYKVERRIDSPQGAEIQTADGRSVINFCANNYLGLANHPAVRRAAADALERWGFGYASVRFICGTSGLHAQLEAALSAFLAKDDTILYAAAFDANGGLFEPLLGPEDAIISDELNHASIIDGVRLCKARRLRYAHADPTSLRERLEQSKDARYRLIATDGVFSMDGDIAPLPAICDLADEYDALVMVDDCHATGYLGARGRGTGDYFGLADRIDLVSGTLGKALGGASGGFISGPAEVIAMLRQRSRPYLFSNTLAPPVAAGSLAALALVDAEPERCARPLRLAERLKRGLRDLDIETLPSRTAIVAVMLYDEARALRVADLLLERGIYAIGFAHPVVPRGKARIRLQLSADHSQDHVDAVLTAFDQIKRSGELG